MLKPLNEVEWVNTDQIQSLEQKGKDVIIWLSRVNLSITLTDSNVDEVAKYLNSSVT